MCPASCEVGLEDGKLLVYSPGEILVAGVSLSYASTTQISVKNVFSGLLFFWLGEWERKHREVLALTLCS